MTEGRREAKLSASNFFSRYNACLNSIFRFAHTESSRTLLAVLGIKAPRKGKVQRIVYLPPCHHKRVYAYTPTTVMPEIKSSYLLTMPDELIITVFF